MRLYEESWGGVSVSYHYPPPSKYYHPHRLNRAIFQAPVRRPGSQVRPAKHRLEVSWSVGSHVGEQQRFTVTDGGQRPQHRVETEGGHWGEEVVHSQARWGVSTRSDYGRWWYHEDTGLEGGDGVAETTWRRRQGQRRRRRIR